MCGIIGYIGKNQALPILLDGLKRLEYRGYDSSGIAIKNTTGIESAKAIGKIIKLEEKLATKNISGHLGIAHTRWATHGAPTEKNAHPHTDCSKKIWLVHNGIIENYNELKNMLKKKNHKFKSETDTEVVVHLLEDLYDGDITNTLKKALKLIKGAYALAIIHNDEPDKLLVAKCGSPLVIGIGDQENIIASDITAIVRHTKQVLYIQDNEIVELSKDNFKIISQDNQEIKRETETIELNIEKIQKNGFPDFMLKEIFEQDEAIINSMRGRTIKKAGKVKLGGLENTLERLRNIKKIIIVACGTAYHAGLIGKYMLEEYAGIITTVEYASEFRYRKPILDDTTAVLAISQSGETADTLAAIKEAKGKNILTLGIVNAVGSSIARETDAGIYNHIGPEIAVASTKAFTSQLIILTLLTVLLGRQREMSFVMGERIIKELELLPNKVKEILKKSDEIKKIAKKYYQYSNFAFLGRKYNYPTAIEGALKLKEISYIHAEGFPSGEMKHGSIALIDKNFPSMFLIPADSVYEKNISNAQEIKTRAGKIIVIATKGDKNIKSLADDIFYIPKTLEMLTPILTNLPLQLFAYHMAKLNKRDIDKPRNLAKSVTVE